MTIRDVAKSAGVSYQTVSRALNDKGEIDGGTKQRVLDTARELGFRPSRFARGLVRQDTTSIGLVVPDLLNPFFTEVASAALDAARLRGWHVVVYDTADDAEQELATLRVIGTQVDAVIGYLSAPATVVERHTTGLPVVYFERDPRPGSARSASRARPGCTPPSRTWPAPAAARSGWSTTTAATTRAGASSGSGRRWPSTV